MLSPAAGHSKRQRAKRARARQRPRHDVRGQYRQDDLPVTHIAVATIEDPYTEPGYLGTEGQLDVSARLAPFQHSDGTLSEGALGWTPPRRPTMTVIRALRDDPVGRMHSRRQIDEAQFKGARAYQQVIDQAQLGTLRSTDLTKTRVSGGLQPDPLPDRRRKAMERLRAVEQRLAYRYGAEGLGLTRAVLCGCLSVEATARQRGAETDREVWFWSCSFPEMPRRPGRRVRFLDSAVPAAAAERAGRARPGARSGTAGRRPRSGGCAVAVGAGERGRLNARLNGLRCDRPVIWWAEIMVP